LCIIIADACLSPQALFMINFSLFLSLTYLSALGCTQTLLSLCCAICGWLRAAAAAGAVGILFK